MVVDAPTLAWVCTRPSGHSGKHRWHHASREEWLSALRADPRGWEVATVVADPKFPAALLVREHDLGIWNAFTVVTNMKSPALPLVVPCGNKLDHAHPNREDAISCAQETVVSVQRLLRQEGETARRQQRSRKAREGPEWSVLRRQVLTDEPVCRLCGARATEVDHIVPLFHFGSRDRENLQPLCRPCHVKKSRHDAHEPDPTSIGKTPPLQTPVDVPVIAERLGKHPRTVQRWLKDRRLPTPDWPDRYHPWWEWKTVAAWAERTGRKSSSTPSGREPPP